MKKTKKEKIMIMSLTGLFAALLCAVSPFSIPLPFGEVPLSTATLIIYAAGAILGPAYAAVSVIVYIIIGCLGVPVFSGFTAGPGRLLGPTGGYLAGYIPLAFISGFSRNVNVKSHLQIAKNASFMIAGTAALYIFGTAWYCIYADIPAIPAITVCVLPFIPGDLLKIIAAAVVCERIHALHAKRSAAIR